MFLKHLIEMHADFALTIYVYYLASNTVCLWILLLSFQVCVFLDAKLNRCQMVSIDKVSGWLMVHFSNPAGQMLYCY